MECAQVVAPTLPAGVRPAPSTVGEPGREDRTSLSGWLGETPPAVETSNRGQPTRTRRLRGSCDFCTKRKRKCDGDPDLTQTRHGDNRCSFCITKNRPECHYSERLPTGPRVDGRQDVNRAARNSLDTAAFNRKRLPRGPGDDHGHDQSLPPGVVVARAAQLRDWMLRGGGGVHGTGSVGGPVATLKRARLGPSAATGLVGLHENAYIGDFFRTLGFLPLTNESMIRKAIVTSVFRTMQQHDSGFSGQPGGGGPMGGGWSDGTLAHTSSGGRYEEVEADAASCVLWCTVALGYLVCGRPKEAVVGYVRLANESLALCFKDACAETARAVTAMALVQNFLGNEVLFDKYVKIAAAIVKTLPAEEVPADLTNTLLFFKACDMFVGNFRFGSGPLRETMEAMVGDQDTTRPKERPTILAQQDLCRWVLETDTRLGACFNQDMFDGGIFDMNGECVSTPMSRADRDKAMPPVPSSNVVYDDPVSRGFSTDGSDTRIERLGPFEDDEDDGDIMGGEPPPPGKMSRMFAAETLRDYDMLDRATRIPEVRGGAGELYIRSITAYIDVLEGNITSSYDHLLRGAEVMIANPGICRLSAWGHLAHCTLACLVVTGDYENYVRLRLAYNTVADCPAMERAPPWEEWTGMRPMCGTVFCRSIYSFFMTANRDNSPATSPKASKPGDKVPVSPRDDDVDSSLYQSSDDSWATGTFTKGPIVTATATRPVATVARAEVVQRRITVDEALTRSPGVGVYAQASTAPRVYVESPSIPDGYSEKTGNNQRSYSETHGNNPGSYSVTPSSTGSYSDTSSSQGRYSETPSNPARYPETSSIPESFPEKASTKSSSNSGGYSETPSVPGRYPEKASISEGYSEKTSSNPGGYAETPSVPAGYPDKATAQPRGYPDTQSSTSQGVYAETPSVPTVYAQTSSATGDYAQQASIPGRYSSTPSTTGRYAEAPSNPESYPEKNSTPGRYPETAGIPGQYPEPAGIPGSYPVMPSIPGRYSETPSNPGSYSEKTSNPGSYSETVSMSGSYSEAPSNPGSYSETVAVAVGGDASNPIFRFGRAYAAGGDGNGIGVGLGQAAPVGLRAGGEWGASLEKVGGAAPFSANPGTVSDAASLSDGATSPGSSGLGSSFHSVEAGLGGEGGMGDRKGSSASFDAGFDTQGIAGFDAEQQPDPIAKRVGLDSSNKLEMKPPLPFPPPSPSAGGLEGGFGGLEYGVPDLGRGKEDHLLDAVDMLFRDEGFEGYGDGEGGDMLF